MRTRNGRGTVAAALKDVRRDWQGWSGAERFTLKLAGSATLALAVILYGAQSL